MPKPRLTFLGWSRERIGGLAGPSAHDRARAETPVTLTGRDAGGATTAAKTRTLAFLLAGPGDVIGLKSGAVTRRYPAPGAPDAETDKCSHVEFADPTLPWRYSPAGNPGEGTGVLAPWLALVVGIEGTELTPAGGSVSLSPEVQKLHPLGGTSPWAHVQVDDSGRRVARLVSGRPLDPDQAYTAVLVPAFDATGAPAWTGAARSPCPSTIVGNSKPAPRRGASRTWRPR